MGLWTLTDRINPVPFFAGFFSVKHRVPSRGWPKVRGPKSKVRTAIFQTSTLDFGPWTLDPNQSRPDFPDGGAKRHPYCVRGREKPQRHRLTACAGKPNPKRHPLLRAGLLKQVRPHLRFGLIRRESSRPAPRRPRRAVFPAPGFDLEPRTSAHACGGSSTSDPVFGRPRPAFGPTPNYPASDRFAKAVSKGLDVTFLGYLRPLHYLEEQRMMATISIRPRTQERPPCLALSLP